MSSPPHEMDTEFFTVCRFVEDLLFYQNPQSLRDMLKWLPDHNFQHINVQEVYQKISDTLEPFLVPVFKRFLGISGNGPTLLASPFSSPCAVSNTTDELLKEQEIQETTQEKCPMEELKNLLSLDQRCKNHSSHTSVEDINQAIQLFDEIYQGLDRDPKKFEILVKCLALYMEGCFSLPELLNILEELPISTINVLPQLKEFLRSRKFSRNEESNYWSPCLSPLNPTELYNKNSSYVKLLDNSQRPWCSGRCFIPSHVRNQLNDDFVALSRSSEDDEFTHPKHNASQTAMFRVEDEMFELDLVIEEASSLLRLLKPLNQMIEQSNASHTRIKISPPTFKVIHLKVMARLFGTHAQDLLDLMFRCASRIIPPLLERLNERITQWIVIRDFFAKTTWWRTVTKNFYKQFDYRLCFSKFLDKSEIYAPHTLETQALFAYYMLSGFYIPQRLITQFLNLQKHTLSDVEISSAISTATFLNFFYDDTDIPRLRQDSMSSDGFNASIFSDSTDLHNQILLDLSSSDHIYRVKQDVLKVLNCLLDAKQPSKPSSGLREYLLEFAIGSQAPIQHDSFTTSIFEWLEGFFYYPKTSDLNIDLRLASHHLYQGSTNDTRLEPYQQFHHTTKSGAGHSNPVKEDYDNNDYRNNNCSSNDDNQKLIQSIIHWIEACSERPGSSRFPLRVGNSTLYNLIRLCGILFLQFQKLNFYTRCRRDPNHSLSKIKWHLNDEDPTARYSYEEFLEHCLIPRVIMPHCFSQEKYQSELRVATGNQGVLLPFLPMIVSAAVSVIQTALEEVQTTQLVFLYTLYSDLSKTNPTCLHWFKEYLYCVTVLLENRTHYWILSWQTSPCHVRLWISQDVPQILKETLPEVHSHNKSCMRCSTPPQLFHDYPLNPTTRILFSPDCLYGNVTLQSILPGRLKLFCNTPEPTLDFP